MSESLGEQDTAGVIAPPPLIVLGGLALGLGAEWLYALPWLSIPLRAPVGASLVMVAVLALVLVAGSLAGRAPVERPRQRLAFDEPSPASVEATVREGAGEAAAGLGSVEPARPPENIPDGWKWRTVGPLRGRQGNIAVWTGQEVIYWGGDRPGRAPEGAAYDPKADRWRRLSRSPLTNRSDAGAVWTGREVVVFGGVGKPVSGIRPLA